MGFFTRFKNFGFGGKQNSQKVDNVERKCRFESMEERRMLDADPVVAGITYLEGDGGNDTGPDYFEITFEGGAATTQLTQFVINGDQDGDGVVSDGDMLFDVDDTLPGTGGFHGFQFDAANSSGLNASDIESFSVSEDGLTLTVSLRNFEAGDKFGFTIDVDEVERFKLDKIASGVEFEGTLFNATFEDQNYIFVGKSVSVDHTIEGGFNQNQTEGIFFDEYDELFARGGEIAGTNLDLDSDNETQQSNRNDGAIDAYDLVPKPVTIEGRVYHDENTNCNLDNQELGIEGVGIQLWILNDSGSWEAVASTTTDANGDYSFGSELELKPGTYRVVETQPDGYLSVGAESGAIFSGVGPGVLPYNSGDIQNDPSGEPNIISNIEIPLGGSYAIEYNFCEVRPASISGHVWHDRNDDGVMDPGEERLANVEIQVTRVGSKYSGNDPFAGTNQILLRTDSNGFYNATGLPPGIYEIVEINNYPENSNPLDGFIDGKDSIGTVGGVQIGQQSNDRFNQIELCADDEGVQFNFGELKPVSLNGYVSIVTPDGECLDPDDPNYQPIAGVTINLFDENGRLADTTRTDSDGFYSFSDLSPGTYSIVEVQPGFYMQGSESIGNVGGALVGTSALNRFDGITLRSGDSGVRYDFCEVNPPASIEGFVHADVGGDCVFNESAGDTPLEGVKIALLDSSGELLARTTTDENGFYRFDGLEAGTYTIREVTPDGLLDGGETVGTIDGNEIGRAFDDRISGITVAAGDAAVQYNFCEHVPAKLSGHVWYDHDNDGVRDVRDPTEIGIKDVVIQLFDADNNLVAVTETDSDGYYCFHDLLAGEYRIKEIQPTDYLDGQDNLGTVHDSPTGKVRDDAFVEVVVKGGQEGINYDFGELRAASIAGYVHTDFDGDCLYEASDGDYAIQGVEMQLFNADGDMIAMTLTDDNGYYQFDGLFPGSYSVVQVQPDQFFTVGQRLGYQYVGYPGGPDPNALGNYAFIDHMPAGDTRGVNVIAGIEIGSGAFRIQNNFCEQVPAKIRGRVWEDGPAFDTNGGELPADYRDQRDGVYQPGVDTPIEGVRMDLWYFNDISGGSLNPRPVTLADVIVSDYPHMAGMDLDTPVFTFTDANGEYIFSGLKPGNYIVLEEQPEGFTDANDIPGTTTGFTYNSELDAALAPATLTASLSTEQLLDSVNAIQVQSGQTSAQNNFTEVSVNPDPQIPVYPPPETPNPTRPTPPTPPAIGQPSLAGAQALYVFDIPASRVGFGVDASPPSEYSWHLSVINAGDPRGDAVASGNSGTVWMNASFVDDYQWSRDDMNAVGWVVSNTKEDGTLEEKGEVGRFGMIEGMPIAGDWDGDGVDEFGVFIDGYFFIDINGNGTWDAADLVAKLGDSEDQAVVGDWDGDGKDDIGIFGPMWPNDEVAIAREPGLPNPANRNYFRPKNVPPRVDEATDGHRVMRLSSTGAARADAIDHVFRYGREGDVAIAGDWNGNGIRSIGVYRDGTWRIDMNGNGRFDSQDEQFLFGQAGDVPIVGDFNGDGIEEVGVYRNGTWIIDINGNRERDAQDKVFEMGDAGDYPVVGDWDGDGVDDPALYRTSATDSILTTE